MVECEYCYAETGTDHSHDACDAMMNYRASEGVCLWCGERDAVRVGEWCAECGDDPNVRYRGYPPDAGEVEALREKWGEHYGRL